MAQQTLTSSPTQTAVAEALYKLESGVPLNDLDLEALKNQELPSHLAKRLEKIQEERAKREERLKAEQEKRDAALKSTSVTPQPKLSNNQQASKAAILEKAAVGVTSAAFIHTKNAIAGAVTGGQSSAALTESSVRRVVAAAIAGKILQERATGDRSGFSKLSNSQRTAFVRAVTRDAMKLLSASPVERARAARSSDPYQRAVCAVADLAEAVQNGKTTQHVNSQTGKTETTFDTSGVTAAVTPELVLQFTATQAVTQTTMMPTFAPPASR